MTNDLLQKAKDVATAAQANGSLVPLETSLTHLIGQQGARFELRHLQSATPKHLQAEGPKPNPFLPWDQHLEVKRIGNSHAVILNKYPVQSAHMLLITKTWQPQSGWLSMEDWNALALVDAMTTGLWFFNSGPDAGASQPHRHLQLLPRAPGEPICARQTWFQRCAEGITSVEDEPLLRSSRVVKLASSLTGEKLHQVYLTLAEELELGTPEQNDRPQGAYNLLMSRDWMALIRRRREGIHGFNVNALGFAGSLLSTDASDRAWIERKGPEALLHAVADAVG
ncbi:hypothetical protein KR52_09745 [Synechococcus sp. KORDI-52]|uniref:DUF4922 domain-containing protein n=1 Tax=Synechococcus sp. KORDI-52 TaxID=585425 RepID=UPI0004E090B9|nr:DUF4922 domain-containing protein [Synechococcus sp. KORDI-52]AII49422.1 hypothetical protein KR52_09745 [Synechococcus sp. KORDI-52]